MGPLPVALYQILIQHGRTKSDGCQALAPLLVKSQRIMLHFLLDGEWPGGMLSCRVD